MNVVSLLTYEYVPDMAERRVPYRDAHLALLNELHETGDVLLGGAVGDPPHAGAIVFRTPEAAHAFVAADPYGAAGLVVSSKVEPWAIPVGEL
jgi:uncharacterized protein YciI